MASSLGMLDSWQRILELIPPSRRSSPEQQQRLGSMQLSMMMGVAAMDQRKAQRQQRDTAPRSAEEQERKQESRQRDERAEDEGEEEEESVEDEEGDDEEIRAMKAEIRQLRAEQVNAATASVASLDRVSGNSAASDAPPPLPPQQVARPAHIDDPD